MTEIHYSHFAVLVGSEDPNPKNLVRGFHNRFQANEFAHKENSQSQEKAGNQWHVLDHNQTSIDFPQLVQVCR